MVDAATFKAEQEEADRLMTTAKAAAQNVLSDTTVAVAQALVRTLGGEQTPQQVASRLTRLRHDPGIVGAINKDLNRAQGQAFFLIGDALWMGYRKGAVGRAQAMSTPGMSILVNLTPDDRQALVSSYPILGHTVEEIAGHLTAKLRYDLDAALALPITGSSDPAQLPADVRQLGYDHASRVAGAVDSAYYAGVQAAVKAIGSAITGRA